MWGSGVKAIIEVEDIKLKRTEGEKSIKTPEKQKYVGVRNGLFVEREGCFAERVNGQVSTL